MSKESKQDVTLEKLKIEPGDTLIFKYDKKNAPQISVRLFIESFQRDYPEAKIIPMPIGNDLDFIGREKQIADLEAKHKAELKEAKRKVAQECYLQCLAVECGEGECAQTIRTKFNLLPSKDEQ